MARKFLLPLKCVSIITQECKVRPKVVNLNSDEPVFFPSSIKARMQWQFEVFSFAMISKIRYAKLCVVKNINLKVFNLMLRTNKTRHIEWQETCKSKYVHQMKVFVTINKGGIMINDNVNANN